MKTIRFVFSFLILVCVILTGKPLMADESCTNLVTEKIRNATITGAVFMDDTPGFLPPRTPGMFGTPPGLNVKVPFCRVTGYIEPEKNSHIGFEVWLPPLGDWNNRFLGVTNPAFEGAIKYQGLAKSVERGYATASTDTGHRDPGHKWALDHPERLSDWVHRSLHETTVVAKHLIRAYYGRDPDYSYLDGCHNGGRQGLVEAQLYPGDYDGILSGDPAFHLTQLQTGSEYISWLALKDGTEAPAFLPPAKYAVLNRAVLDACDTLDGVKDHAIEDPTRCDFDPASIRCEGPELGSCLTADQVETVRRIYTGARFADGTQIYSGFEPGSELRWGAMIEGPEPLFINNDFFKYIAFGDPEWDWRTFDIDMDTRRINKKLGKIINNINPDLRAFRKYGGKLIVYQSWNETWVPPRTITGYYNEVTEAMGGEQETKDFFRLFMVPDCAMCPGGDAGTFDALTALQKWREEGIAPDHIQANYSSSGQIYKTRPVCAYPEVAIYRGEGDINRAENYSCGKPTW